MLIPKQNRIRDAKYRKWIASLSCCVSGKGEVQCAHIREGCYSAGMKPSDDMCVPLNYLEHDRQHHIGEEKFWQEYGGIERAKKLAKDLYAVKYDTRKAKQLIKEFKND